MRSLTGVKDDLEPVKAKNDALHEFDSGRRCFLGIDPVHWLASSPAALTRLRNAGDRLPVSVTDTDIGLPQELAEQIFNAFTVDAGVEGGSGGVFN